MDKHILMQMYKPISIHEYNDEYFEGLLEAIDSTFSNKSFNWYIECIKYFLNCNNNLSEELIVFLENYNEESVDLIKNKAELIIISQIILYKCIKDGKDKNLSFLLSLALNTVMFGRSETLNHSYVNSMKMVYREIWEEVIKKFRICFANYNNESKNDGENINITELTSNLDFLYTENKVLKWLLNLEMNETSEIKIEQFAFYVGREFAIKCGKHAVFNYPEAYISKALISFCSDKDIISKKIPIIDLLNKINVTELEGLDNCLFPILGKTVNLDHEISLIDFAIEVYYEQMLFNHLKISNNA